MVGSSTAGVPATAAREIPRAVVVQELDDQVRMGAHDRHGGFVGGQSVEDLPKLQRRNGVGWVPRHLGKCLVREEDGAV